MPLTNTEVWTEVKSAIAILQAKVDSAVNDLQTEANRLSDPWDFIEQDKENQGIQGADPVTAPVIGTFTKPAFVFNPEDYVNGDLVKYRYESDFFLFLDPQLRDSILNETVGIAAYIQQDIFDQMHDRDLQTLNDALDAVDRKQAQRGFPIPTSMMLAARNDVIKKYQDTRNDRNREVTALIAERAQANVHHAIDSGLKMEDINSRFQLEYAKMFYVMAEVLIKKYATEAEVAIKEFQTNAEAAIKRYEADVTNQKLTLEEDALYIQRLRSYIDQNNQIARALIEQSEAATARKLAASQEVVNYYKSQVMGTTGQMNVVNVETTTT
jgi:hypothetical protein